MASQHQDFDMTSGPLFKKIFVFSLPIMAMNVLQLLFNATNMIVVGRYTGSEALAAVGATGALINLILNFFMGLSVGTSVVIAQDYGADDPANVSRGVHTSMFISIIAGFIVMVLGLALCDPLLILMGTPKDILALSSLYMKIYFVGVPGIMVFNFGAAILRAVGDSRRPMYYLVIGGVLNVVLNLVLVIVFHLGVAGVAWSTIVSQYLSMVLVILCLIRSESAIRFSPRRMLQIDRQKLIQIIKIGLPAGLQGLLFSISNVLIQSAVNSFGSTMVAASSAASNIEGFVGMVMNAYYTAAITFTGQNMGAKKYPRIDTIAKVSTVLIFSTWILIGGLTMLLARPLISIYTTDPNVINLGVQRIHIMMVAYFTCGLMNVFPGLTRGMGYSMLPMVITLVGACLLRIVWLVTFFAWYPTEVILFVCYPITWGMAGIGQVAVYFYARVRVRRRAAQEALLAQ